MGIAKEHADKILKELPHLLAPAYHNIKPKDVNMKRLGSILWLAQENETEKFEEPLLLKGLDSRTLQPLILVRKEIYRS